MPGANNLGRFQYTGQAWLPELGLYYYKSRMYSSRLGRFMQTDPIGYGDGMNRYNYVGSDPVNSTDPSGLFCTGERDEVCGRGNGGGGFGLGGLGLIPGLTIFSPGLSGGLGDEPDGPDIIVRADKNKGKQPILGKGVPITLPQNGQHHKYVMLFINQCPESKVLGYFKQAGHSVPGALATTEEFTQRIVLTGNNQISQTVN